ncbi:transaldolase [Jonesia quinghaiensis]|uniref:transaldolase n=1 Tax=Jonesia quinghaiensis TaxID=262806 RepID=UPI00042852A2|nr:transaldolase [Jonesia quinghaiensis]
MDNAAARTATDRLSAQAVSIWLDDLSRDLVDSGELESLITDRSVVGVTTNPSIFAASVAASDTYDEALRASGDRDAQEVALELMVQDVARACDVFAPVYESTGGQDGRVSIEVSPLLAHDAQETARQAVELARQVDRPGVLVKIPATVAGLSAITEVVSQGVSVNATLIFSVQRYREVIGAYLAGLEKAREAGHDLESIHSVASFFVSRVDTEVDTRLLGREDARAGALTGRVGVANARVAYDVFTTYAASPQMQELLLAGANLQRPLWASTGVKDPALRDTMYVEELIAESVVNTMPRATLEAFWEHGEVPGNSIIHAYDDAYWVMDTLSDVGVDFDDVAALLEEQGVNKFVQSWNDLLETIERKRAGVQA